MSRAVLIDASSTAGGLIHGTGARIKVGGVSVVVVNDSVASHGDGIHAAAIMADGEARLTIAGTKVCFENNPASCGHLGASGSARMTIA